MVPFYGHAGDEIPTDDIRSRHVYTPLEELLTRTALVELIEERGFACQVVDPGDLRPLADGPLVGECLLLSRDRKSLETLGRHRVREHVIKNGNVVLVDLVVDAPFEAEAVLGDAEQLIPTFGEEGARRMQQARTLYAINLPAQASTDVECVLRDLSEVIAKEVSGCIYDSEEGRFI